MSDASDEKTQGDPDPTQVMESGHSPASIQVPASRWARPLSIARGVLLITVLLLAWAVLIPGSRSFEPEIDPIYSAGYIVMLVALGIVTATALASLRYERLRRALLPFEVGLFVSVAIIVAGVRGVEVDTNEDAVFIAVLFGFGASLVVAFANTLLDEHRYRGAWIVGVASVVALIGISMPLIADRVSPIDEYDPESYQRYLVSDLMTRVAPDGAVRLTAVDPNGMNVDARIVSDPALHPSAPSAGATAAIGAPLPLRVRLVTDTSGALRLEVEDAPSFASQGGAVRVEVRRGSCEARSAADILVRDWRVSARGRGTSRNEFKDVTLDDLQLDDTLYAAIGSGAPLAPVTCVDLIDPRGVALAQAGLARMHDECVKPLGADSEAVASLTADSFQDAACARRFQELVDIAGGMYLVNGRAAAALVQCLDDATISSTLVRVGGGAIVTNVELDDDPDVIARAQDCFDTAGPATVGWIGGGIRTGENGAVVTPSVGSGSVAPSPAGAPLGTSSAPSTIVMR
jgi:hypothetical protein